MGQPDSIPSKVTRTGVTGTLALSMLLASLGTSIANRLLKKSRLDLICGT